MIPSAEEIGALVDRETPRHETPSQHLRNALGALYTLDRTEKMVDVRVESENRDGEHEVQVVSGFFISDETLANVFRRVWKAIKELEARP